MPTANPPSMHLNEATKQHGLPLYLLRKRNLTLPIVKSENSLMLNKGAGILLSSVFFQDVAFEKKPLTSL